MKYLPAFAQEWYADARAAIESGLHTHQWALAALVAAIPAIMFLRGLFGYLNVYCLQWVSSRTIADLRTRLFAHLLNLSAGFYTENSSGQLISRVMNDTGSLQNILSGATSVIVRDPITLISALCHFALATAEAHVDFDDRAAIVHDSHRHFQPQSPPLQP